MKEIDSDLCNIIFVNFPLTCTKEMWCSVSRASHLRMLVLKRLEQLCLLA